MKINALENHKFLSVSCGDRHSCGLTTRGEIYTWGKVDFHKDLYEINLNDKKRKEVIDYSDIR